MRNAIYGFIVGITALIVFTMPDKRVESLAAPIVIDNIVPLKQHTNRAIELSNPKLSTARKATVATLLTFIAEDVFENRLHQEFWISLIGIESRYEGSAKSHKGATGLGQLMPQYKADFGKGCGLTEVDTNDLNDDFTNAYLSACYFRDLIKAHGTMPLALISYNAGSYSSSLKNTKAGGKPVEEASAYVTKIWVKNQAIKKETK